MEREQEEKLGVLQDLHDRLSAEVEHIVDRLEASPEQREQPRYRLILRRGVLVVALIALGAAMLVKNAVRGRPGVTVSLAAATVAVAAAIVLIPQQTPGGRASPQAEPRMPQGTPPAVVVPVPVPRSQSPASLPAVPSPDVSPQAVPTEQPVEFVTQTALTQQHEPVEQSPEPPTSSAQQPPASGSQPPGTPVPPVPQPAPSPTCVALLPGVQLHLGQCVSGVVGLVGDITKTEE